MKNLTIKEELKRIISQKQNPFSFIFDYRVAALSSSSNFLLGAVLKEIPDKLFNVVEFGPGDGVMSRKLLQKLDKNGKIILVEQNKEFISILKEIKDPRVVIVSGLAEDFDYNDYFGQGIGLDLVISSIPFYFLDSMQQESVVKKAFLNLKTGGKLVLFHQYRLVALPLVKKYFSSVKHKFVMLNIFPCFYVIAKK